MLTTPRKLSGGKNQLNRAYFNGGISKRCRKMEKFKMIIKNVLSPLQHARDYVHHMSEQTIAKVAVAVGSSGSLYDYFNDYTGWVDIFIKYGNALLLCGGMYMMATNVAHRVKKRRDRKSRKTDVED